MAPDGFPVAVVRKDASGAPVPLLGVPTLVAEGADVRPGQAQPPLHGFVVVPRAGSRDVVVRARVEGLEAQARFVLGPPATEVKLGLEPAAPVKGRDKEAVLTVSLLRPDGTADDSGAPPVVRASTGRVEGLERVAPGMYRARYLLPDTRHPEVAILAAFSAWPSPQSVHGAYGRVLVPLAASVNLPGTTEPDARISIDIAGERFGPVTAGPDGRFRLPIVVPPGHRFGQGHVMDRVGNLRRERIDLMLPPTDGLACVLQPQRLPADGVSRARLLCATSDPMGKPVEDAKVMAQARHGVLKGPSRAVGGMLEWLYTAPRSLTGDEHIEAAWPQRGAGSREVLLLQLVQGPVADVALAVADSLVHRGGRVGVTVRTRDALGHPRPGAVLSLEAPEGRFTPPVEASPGELTSQWHPPDSGGAERVDLSVRAWGPAGGEPARISVWPRKGVLHVGVSDLAGLPVPSQPLRVDGHPVMTGPDGTVSLGRLAPGTHLVAHGVWTGLTRTLHVLGDAGLAYPLDAPAIPDDVSRQVQVAPPVPVNVRLRVEGARVTYWVEDASGQLLEGRQVHVALSEGAREAQEVRGGRTSFTVRAERPVSVSVADVATGVTALAEVRP